ncbi:MAG TPA: EamA family transporter [Rectinemataceae bacterium]|nr:EamA family transporter [Rectinemataceae bacterium]
MHKRESPTGLPASAVGLALLIAAIWGFNFVVIDVGVASVPPLMLAALRFVFSAFPALLFVKRPAAPLRSLALYGILLGVGEFGFLFTAIKLGAPPGISSILLQFQAFFTAALAAVFLRERLSAWSLGGMGIAAAGLLLFALSSGAGAGAVAISLPLLAMILLAALGWAGANVVTRSMPGTSALGLMVWSSLFSPIPLAGLSLLFEGPRAIAAAALGISWLSVGALAYLVIMSTLLGYGLWNHLILKHGAGRIAPFSLLVPIFGVLSAALALGERFGTRDALGASLVLAGVLLHVFGTRLARLSGPGRG